MAAVQGQFTLPLLAFQHHVGQLYVDPADLQWGKGLGQSELAVVEQGRWRKSDGKFTSIVCKVWRPFVVATPQDFRELLLEASKLHRLQHPNIVRFLGLGCFAHGSLAEVRESMFMVEEYVGERTIRKVISEQMRCRHKNLYDAKSALRWASQVASALAALHEQQPAYVHNDVKADNVFLTDQPSIFSPRDAKLGDLKPHRHVYDREPCTLSRHQQQQQRSQSPKAAGQPASTLQQPRYSLERNSGCSSSGQAERRLSWSCATSSVELGPGEHITQGHVGTTGTSIVACKGVNGSSGRELPLQQQQQQQQQHEQRPQPAFLRPGPLPPGIRGSWSSGCSTATTPDAAAAPAVHATDDTHQQQQQQLESGGVVARVRSLPVPITGHGSSVHKGSSCPTNWNPGMADGHPGSPSAAAAESPGYFSASSHCTYSSTGSTTLNSSSLALLHEASSCPSSAPPHPCSLTAEIAAADAAAAASDADAAAAAAETAAGGSAGVDVWRAVGRHCSVGGLQCLSDSASSTGVTRGSGGKEGVGSLAADADEEEVALATAVAADDAMAPVHDLDSPLQQQHCFRGRQHPRGRQGALAAAFASVEDTGHHCQQQQGPYQQQLQLQQELSGVRLADSPPDVGTAAPSSPQRRLLGLLYKRSKASSLDGDSSCQPHLQLVHSAPDVSASSDLEDAVHRGSLLLPLPLSEPTGLCSLQSAGSSGGSWGEGGKGRRARGRTSTSAAPDAAGDRVTEQLQGKQPAEVQLRHAHTHPCSSASGVGGSCVYYGWELLPSGAASPCGAVHSSMLDLFADMTNDDVITNRRYRDSCHYTLVPGSFVQQRLPMVAPITRSKSAGAAWDASAPAGTIGLNSSGSSQAAASAGSKWTPTTLLQLQQQQQGSEQLERSTSIGKGCAPTAIESKQHGSNSAFAALTAIDCIAEEGSSMATDSCAPSRDTSAHGNYNFYSTSRDVSQWGPQDALHTPPQQGAPQSPHSSLLPALVTSSSLSKALGLSLLRQRSGASTLTRNSSGGLGGLGDDDRLDSVNTKSPPASPQASLGSAHSSSSSSSPRLLQAGGDSSSSPCKKQLLAAAPDNGQGSFPDADLIKRQVCVTADAADSFTSQRQGLTEDVTDAAGSAAAAVPVVKKVRFSLARPEGETASRDFSLLYAAPELVRGERPTEKVDVFAFGVLLYELLSRRLVASSVAAVCAQHSSSRRGSSRHSKHRQQQHHSSPWAQAPACGDSSGCSSSGSDGGTLCEEQPEEQLLLQYAQLVAGGYRPPMLPHFPEPVLQLISSCWAAEPYERPRMAEVLAELQAWQRNRGLMSRLNGFVLALADIGYTGAQRKEPSCGCVIS